MILKLTFEDERDHLDGGGLFIGTGRTFWEALNNLLDILRKSQAGRDILAKP